MIFPYMEYILSICYKSIPVSYGNICEVLPEIKNIWKWMAKRISIIKQICAGRGARTFKVLLDGSAILCIDFMTKLSLTITWMTPSKPALPKPKSFKCFRANLWWNELIFHLKIWMLSICLPIISLQATIVVIIINIILLLHTKYLRWSVHSGPSVVIMPWINECYNDHHGKCMIQFKFQLPRFIRLIMISVPLVT